MSENEVNEQEIRAKLIKNIFEAYQHFMVLIHHLPIPKQITGMQKAIIDIDTGMVWIKELLMTAPLSFPKPKEEETP